MFANLAAMREIDLGDVVSGAHAYCASYAPLVDDAHEYRRVGPPQPQWHRAVAAPENASTVEIQIDDGRRVECQNWLIRGRRQSHSERLADFRPGSAATQAVCRRAAAAIVVIMMGRNRSTHAR